MSDERPVVYGIPFSHFCQKAEWGLTQAGIEYDYVSISLPKMSRLSDITQTGLVPFMRHGDLFLEGSDRIMDWAAANAKPSTDPLYPSNHEQQIREWEQWANDVVGPVARREAYRVAYSNPWRFTKRWSVRLLARLGRGLILNILKFYKARRFDAEDVDAVPRIIIKIASRLRATGTGFLFAEHATAADLTVAALCRPLVYAAPGRTYHAEPGWELLLDFVEGVKPKQTTRQSKRAIRDSEWHELERLAKQPIATANAS